ncbi:MAG TPA: primosomal protein N', partial [Syntrophaceae bacterium]|nr:primosomal protein N' [Syntrophaceae bacterium]
VFRKRFGDRVAVLHSKLGLNVRYDQWMRVRKKEADVVIGTRSAIFAPFDQPGLIIVDEEHDTSYKQEKKLRYNARDLAVVRAKMAKAVLILGSATPSIQSYYNVMSHKFKYLPLLSRVGGGVLPKVSLVDMRGRKNKDGEILSPELKEAIGANLQRGEQTLLFLNRRGFAGFILCTSCGYVFRCLNCHISLTYHLKEATLCCHYCGFTLRSPALCRNCQGKDVLYLGLGTERVEEEVKRLYPLARVARMDRDVMIGRRSYVKILKGLRDGTIDILIGTQMITKGHHFPNVTLVGVILADLSLNIPDFRASERTFQLLAQVAGRAGRGERPGEVMIQTYNPHHYSVLSAMNHDFFRFYKDEITKRRELSYPPFSHLINFKIRGNSLQSVVQYSYKLGDLCRSLQQKCEESRNGLQVLGPVAAPLSKIKGKYRWQLLIKGRQVRILHGFCKRVLEEARGIRIPGVQLIVDVDPMNML